MELLGLMPLICLCLSYPVSVSLSDAADLILRRAFSLDITDCSNKIPGYASYPVRRSGPAAE